MKNECSRERTAFTLVELLVVIAIIGILVALLLPAVQAARESARRMKCVNQMKQWALGMQLHHDAKKRLPPGGWSSDGGDGGSRHGWVQYLWPYVEETAIADKYDYDVCYAKPPNAYLVADPLAASAPSNIPIPLYYCPSDRGNGFYRNKTASIRGNYVCNWGPMPFQPPVGHTVIVNKIRAPFGLKDYVSRKDPLRTKFGEFTDGTSATLVLSEEIMHPNDEVFDGRGDILNDVGDECFMTVDTPNSSAQDAQWGTFCVSVPETPCISAAGSPNRRENYSIARSRHPGGVNAAYADGHVIFVNNDIALDTWKAISTMNGQEIASIEQ
jgi:prepilin-type processing-associated H-X9-DG protein/prepilin-type N-terminal cleavage/methylation domain-containing protein